MYFFNDFMDRSGEGRPLAKRGCVRRSNPPMRLLRASRGANLMGALCEVARSLPPDVMQPWLGLSSPPAGGERLAGASSGAKTEPLDATSILILVVAVAHEKPVTFREIERWLPSWARSRREALGDLLEADLLVIEPLAPHEPVRFSVSADGRAVALHEAVHLLLSIGGRGAVDGRHG